MRDEVGHPHPFSQARLFFFFFACVPRVRLPFYLTPPMFGQVPGREQFDGRPSLRVGDAGGPVGQNSVGTDHGGQFLKSSFGEAMYIAAAYRKQQSKGFDRRCCLFFGYHSTRM